MHELDKNERKKLHALIDVYIPNYIIESADDKKYDLMECYEIGFMFAHELLRNHKIDPNVSPWGDGNSVIFEPDYSELLLNIQKLNLDEDVNKYCQVFLDVLDVFKSHLV